MYTLQFFLFFGSADNVPMITSKRVSCSAVTPLFYQKLPSDRPQGHRSRISIKYDESRRTRDRCSVTNLVPNLHATPDPPFPVVFERCSSGQPFEQQDIDKDLADRSGRLDLARDGQFHIDLY